MAKAMIEPESKVPQTEKELEFPQVKVNAARKLARQIQRSEYRMARYRITANQMIKNWCGPWYTAQQGDNSAAEPLNTLQSVVSIILPNLVGTTIRIHTTAMNLEFQDFAKLLELRVNRCLREMRFGQTMTAAAQAAMFSTGLVKTALEGQPLDEDFADVLIDPGKPYSHSIHVDDWVFDPDTKRLSAAWWMGHMVMLHFEDAIRNDDYDKDELVRLRATHMNLAERLRAQQLSRENAEVGDEYVEFVRLCSVYLPREKVIVTLPGIPSTTTKFIAEKEFDGPEMGLYDEVGFYWPPDNALAVPPISHLYDLHLVINSLIRKVRRQSERSKSFVAASQGQIKDGEAVRDVKDGGVLWMQDANQIKQITLGGADPNTYEAISQMREWLNWTAGNPEGIGGLRADAKTLGQDEMKLMQANIRLWDMQQKIRNAERRIVEKIAWYIWDDRSTDVELEQTLPHGSKITRHWDATTRVGEWDDYTLDIEPYIPQSDNPVQQYRRTMELITQVILPLAPLSAQIGQHVDLPALIRSAAEKLDIKDVDRWFKEGPPTDGGQLGRAPGNPMGSGARLPAAGSSFGPARSLPGGQPTGPMSPAEQPQTMALAG